MCWFLKYLPPVSTSSRLTEKYLSLWIRILSMSLYSTIYMPKSCDLAMCHRICWIRSWPTISGFINFDPGTGPHERARKLWLESFKHLMGICLMIRRGSTWYMKNFRWKTLRTRRRWVCTANARETSVLHTKGCGGSTQGTAWLRSRTVLAKVMATMHRRLATCVRMWIRMFRL